MTFDELFAEHRLTPEERAELVLYLAFFRAVRIMRVLGALPALTAPYGGS